MLSLRDIHVSYGSVLALKGVSLEVPVGGIVSLLGANGAGKTTTLRAISGLLHPTSGTIEFEGERIDRMPAERVVRIGISQVPEGRQIFTEFTVMENLRLGAYTRRDRGVRQDIDRICSYFPVLGERSGQRAALLSGGEQQMLAIGRALMAKPRVLLLDEPSLGLAPILVREIFEIIKTINKEEQLTILLVEQDASLALSFADYGYVLESGTVAVEAASEELRGNESVRRSYLGLSR
ncbi:MAG: ABC transporter ATP-binding protein [Chloroflexi bacterium]|nr:ABC transporter ATP-binding protein [Chloroflexota bacterium]